MYRTITLFTGQFADIPINELAKKATGWGYDGLELACWGDHLDVDKAATDKKYVESYNFNGEYKKKGYKTGKVH